MKTNIVKIDGQKIEIIENNEVKEYELASWVKSEYVKLGEAEITIQDGKVSFVSMEDQKQESPKKSESDGKNPHIVNISGKDFMTYEGILKKAHEKNENFNMELTESWVSEDMKRVWCKVRLTAGLNEKRRIFDGFGSSTPENTGKMTSDHPVEMAHTRAKGRALRDYLNIGEVMAEELKDAAKK